MIKWSNYLYIEICFQFCSLLNIEVMGGTDPFPAPSPDSIELCSYSFCPCPSDRHTLGTHPEAKQVSARHFPLHSYSSGNSISAPLVHSETLPEVLFNAWGSTGKGCMPMWGLKTEDVTAIWDHMESQFELRANIERSVETELQLNETRVLLQPCFNLLYFGMCQLHKVIFLLHVLLLGTVWDNFSVPCN